MKKMTMKKLALCRETLAHLAPQDLQQAQGGSIISSDNKECTYTAKGPDTTCWC
jgi:hypothetical protein